MQLGEAKDKKARLLRYLKVALKAIGSKTKPQMTDNWSESGKEIEITVDGIVILPGELESKSIVGTVKHQGWIVYYIKQYGGNREEPPSEDLVEIAKVYNEAMAAATTAEALAKDRIGAAIESESYAIERRRSSKLPRYGQEEIDYD